METVEQYREALKQEYRKYIGLFSSVGQKYDISKINKNYIHKLELC
jgi:hypothetical protein